MKIRTWLGFVLVGLVALPVSAMTVQDFARQAAVQQGAKVETILAALPPGTNPASQLTEGAVVQMMGAVGVRLTTSHPDAAFSDASAGRVLETGINAQNPASPEQGRRKPRSQSPHRPRPPHRRPREHETR